MSQKTKERYAFVTDNALLGKLLIRLGLNFNNTPLDVRYNYDLLMKKIPKDDDLYSQVKKTYKQLTHMLSSYQGYYEELENLKGMDFGRVQSMKLGNRRDLSTFLKDENELINNTIKKIRFDYYKSQITKLLQLRSYVIHDVIEKTYLNYMKIYNPNTLIAFKSMDKQSSGHFKKELEETKKIENVYTKYLNARQELQ